jgi:adiponectin receptor
LAQALRARNKKKSRASTEIIMVPRQTSRTLMVAEALAGWDDADFGREMASESDDRRKRSRRAPALSPPPPPSSSSSSAATQKPHPLRALASLALRPLSGRSDDLSRQDAGDGARVSAATGPTTTTPPQAAEAPRGRAAAARHRPTTAQLATAATTATTPTPAARRRRPTTADALASHPPAALDLTSSSSSSGSDDDEQADRRYDPRQPYRSRLSIKEAPDYVHFPFLMTGYRAGGNYRRNLKALFEWHTETLNAWTMIAGVALSVWQLFLALRGGASASSTTLFAAPSSSSAAAAAVVVRPPQTWREALPFVALTLSCAAHAPFSVGFHLFRGMSPRVYNLWRRLDQAFIFLASVPMAWALAAWAQGGPFEGAVAHGHGWSGSPAARATFGVAALVACWATGVIASLKPGFRRDKRQMVLFVGTIVACYWAPMAAQAWEDVGRWRRLGGGGGAFALASNALTQTNLHPHTILYHGLGAARAALGVLLSLMLGAALYASGFPERRWPGRFDLVGSSHQLMHAAVVSAHAFKHAFLRELWRRRCVEEAWLIGKQDTAAAVGRVLSLRAALRRGAAFALSLLADLLSRPGPLGLSPVTLVGLAIAAAVLLPRVLLAPPPRRGERQPARRSEKVLLSSPSSGGGQPSSPARSSCEIVPSSSSSGGGGSSLEAMMMVTA